MPKNNNRRGSRKQTRQRGTAPRDISGTIGPWSSIARGPEVKLWTSSLNNYALYHNTAAIYGNILSLLNGLGQGTGFFQRIGNQVTIREMRLRLVLNRKTDRPNVSYRVIVVATVPGNGADGFNELFDGGVFSGVHIPGSSSVLHDVTFPRDQGSVMTQQATPDKERSNTYECSIPVNRTVAWSQDSSCLTTLRVYVVAYDAYGTLTTDNIASIAQGNVGVYFTDA